MSELLSGLKFLRKPSPVLVEHRPIYKISQVLLVLSISSRGGRSRLARLHLFNWALKMEKRCHQLKLASSDGNLRITAWGFDPTLAIAVRYAIAEELICEVAGGYKITEKGELIVREILKDDSLLADEIAMLKDIGKGITEAMVDNVAKGWEA